MNFILLLLPQLSLSPLLPTTYFLIREDRYESKI